MSTVQEQLRELADDPRFAKPGDYPEPALLFDAAQALDRGEVLRALVDDYLPRLDRARHPGMLRAVGTCGDCGKKTPCIDQVVCDRCVRRLVETLHRHLEDLLYGAVESPSTPKEL